MDIFWWQSWEWWTPWGWWPPPELLIVPEMGIVHSRNCDCPEDGDLLGWWPPRNGNCARVADRPREGMRSKDCDCPRYCDNPCYGDHSEYHKHPVDGDCLKDCEVLRIWTILGMVTVLGLVTAQGMVTLLEHVLLHCAMMHCHKLWWNCQQNLSYANLNRPIDRQTYVVHGAH